MQVQDQAEELAKFLSGEGGVVTSTVPSAHRTVQNSAEEESSENVAMETEPIVIEDDSKASVEVIQDPARAGLSQQEAQSTVAHSGSRDSPIEIDRAGVAPTRDNLTSTDPRLAQVLPPGPVTAAAPGTMITPYQVQPFTLPQPSGTSQQASPLPSAPLPPNNLALYQAPPPPTFSPYQSPPPPAYQAPPPNFSAYQTPPPYNPTVVSPVTPPVVVSQPYTIFM